MKSLRWIISRALVLCLAVVFSAHAQEHNHSMMGNPSASGSDEAVIDHGYPDDVIVGAGAHFAYVIFDMLKQELEERSHRRIALFGKNSSLGVGCKAAIKMAKQNAPGRETFGFVCCPLSKEEIEQEQLLVYPLADEPIMILVNESNPIDNITSQQVRDIFAGKITNWNQIGGNREPIVVVARLHCKERPGHWKLILPSDKDFRQDRISVQGAAEMVAEINKYPGAFGHTGSTWEFEFDDKVKIVKVDGYLPTAKNLQAGKYPFYRRLSAITNRRPSQEVVAIIRGVQEGESFKKVTERYQLLPVKNRGSEAQEHLGNHDPTVLIPNGATVVKGAM